MGLGAICNVLLQIPPLTKPNNEKKPYRMPLAVSARATSCIPPAPRLVRALNIPTVQRQVKPTRATWHVGDLKGRELSMSMTTYRTHVYHDGSFITQRRGVGESVLFLS